MGRSVDSTLTTISSSCCLNDVDLNRNSCVVEVGQGLLRMLAKTGSWLVEGGDGNDVGSTEQANVSGAGVVETGKEDLRCDIVGTFCVIVDVVAVADVVANDAEAAV